ncbi:MAG: histidine kinase [Clostridiales bacterium]|jgi:two-component system sensor histidine kinase YesM|nr:histidine kinase [Clostridiales bacterium]
MANKVRLLGTLIKNNKFRKSFLKYFAGTASTALVAFVAFAIVSYSMYSMYLRDALSRFREHTLQQGGEFVDLIFDDIEQTMYLIENSEKITQTLTAPGDMLPNALPPAMPRENADGYLKWSDVAYARDAIFEATVLNPAMDSIYVYSTTNRHVVSWTEFSPLETFHDREFLDLREKGYAFYARSKQPGGAGPDVVTVIRDAVIDGEQAAVAVFNISYAVLASRVMQGFYSAPESACLADSGGQVFYATAAALLNTSVYAEPVYSAAFSDALRDGSSARFDGERVVMAMRSAGGGYVTLSSMDASDIASFQRDFVGVAAWAGAIGLLAAFFLAMGISLWLHQNIIGLISYIGGSGDSGAAPEADSEIRYITENITGIVPRDRHIEHALAERLAELKKAQAIALQNQINPHFILNTLQIVNLDILRRTEADTDATRIISLLSEILKSNLNTTDYIVRLSYEIRQASKYMEIERIRNSGGFRVDWDVDPSLGDCRTVKFIIQPVLENCFKHGLAGGWVPNGQSGQGRPSGPDGLSESPGPSEPDGLSESSGPNGQKMRDMSGGQDRQGRRDRLVSIQARAKDRALEIAIRDNGAGMPPQTLAQLRESLRNSHIQENGHIGLCNVDKRIKLVFGDAYGVSIDSAPQQGTTVTIRQKLIRGDWT